MDNSAEVTHLLAQIATEEASLAKLCNIKETLQNEVVTIQKKLEKVQGVKRKQQDKHTQLKKKQKTGQNTNTHGAGMSNNIYHGTNMAQISTRDKVCMAETSVNGPKEHLVMAKSSQLTAVRNLMGESDGVKVTQKNVKERKKTLQNEEDEQKDERQWLHTMKRKQQHKNTYPKKKQETQHDTRTNCTIVPYNINHDTNIPTSITSNIQNIKLDETTVHTETEESLSSNKDEVEAQVQTPKNRRRQYRKRQTTEWRTEQMHWYRARKQPQQIT